MPVNYLSVLLAGVASMVLGFLWYGLLFGKTWIKLMKFSEKDIKEGKKKGMAKLYVVNFISSLVTAFILALLIALTNAVTVSNSMFLALMLWLGFIATTTLGSVLWEGKNIKLYLINNSYNLISLIIMSLILRMWV